MTDEDEISWINMNISAESLGMTKEEFSNWFSKAIINHMLELKEKATEAVIDLEKEIIEG